MNSQQFSYRAIFWSLIGLAITFIILIIIY